MLPATRRMRSGRDFGRTVRSGVRAGRPSVVVHARRCDPAEDRQSIKVGFVVPKTVGGAVTRNRVKRRLRHLAVPLISDTPAGTHLVVRAVPGAATTPRLADDLASAWRRSLERLAGAGS